jgi:hypothetical protein
MANDPMSLFVGVSAVLTGVAAGQLAPDVDPIDIKQVYFATAQKNGGPTFDRLLLIYQQNQQQPPETIGDIIMNQSGDAVRYLARAIILMWYLGSWYPPDALQNPPQTGIPSAVISPVAYTQGWVWSVAQAHPMGYSTLQFGYWASNPPTLTDYING